MAPRVTHEAARVLIHDPTLRDGHHAVRHQLGRDQLRTFDIGWVARRLVLLVAYFTHVAPRKHTRSRLVAEAALRTAFSAPGGSTHGNK